MKEIYPDIYTERLNFMDSHISPLNLYIVRSRERSLLVDTGFHTDYCMTVVEGMVDALDIRYQDLDVFLTHIHPDHTGLAEDLQARGATIYMNPMERRNRYDLRHCYLSDEKIRSESLRTIGVTKENNPEVYDTIMTYAKELNLQNLNSPDFEFQPIESGQTLSYGSFRFHALGLRGHTYGQLGLIESQKKLLFCADQIMTDIVPIVGSIHKDLALLEYYLSSLAMLAEHYKGYLVLPCHYRIGFDLEKEAERIRDSYMDKCKIMYGVLKEANRPMTVREVGVRTYGRSVAPPPPEKFTSCTMIWSKTLSCLDYMYEKGMIDRSEVNGMLYYCTTKEKYDKIF